MVFARCARRHRPPARSGAGDEGGPRSEAASGSARVGETRCVLVLPCRMSPPGPSGPARPGLTGVPAEPDRRAGGCSAGRHGRSGRVDWLADRRASSADRETGCVPVVKVLATPGPARCRLAGCTPGRFRLRPSGSRFGRTAHWFGSTETSLEDQVGHGQIRNTVAVESPTAIAMGFRPAPYSSALERPIAIARIEC